MGFFDFLKEKTQINWNKTLVRDLVMLTAIDGDMDHNEINLVLKIAIEELGFTEKEFLEMMNNLGSVKDIYPTNQDDKFKYMTTLIRMTYSDGIIDENELEFMKIIASKMNLPEDGVEKAIKIIENSKNKNNDSFNDDSSIGKIIITSPHDPSVEVQTENGVARYLNEIKKLSLYELSIELNNVMAAKHNKMSLPSSIETFSDTQRIVTDLTDKALWICIIAFGQEKVLQYCNSDTRIFNELLNDIDSSVAELELVPAAHGKKVLDIIAQELD